MTELSPNPSPKKPRIIPLDGLDELAEDAAPILDAPAVTVPAMARLGPRSGWGGAVVLTAIAVLLGAYAWVTAMAFLDGLLVSFPILGLVFAAAVAVLATGLTLFSLGEIRALIKMRSLAGLRRRADACAAQPELATAMALAGQVDQATPGPRFMDNPEFKSTLTEQLDADAVLALIERDMVGPLDHAALRDIEAATRQVATITAIMPLPVIDMLTALAVNLRMIRRVSQRYGGRAGWVGSWRLIRAVLGHLVATGAVAIGDDLIGSVAGGSVLGKVSRRFGEGVVNAALTARVGMAAMDVCRPMPHVNMPRPRVTGILRRALVGLFS